MKINSTADLRQFLLQQMQGVAKGTVSQTDVRSICNLSQQVYNTLKVELMTANMMGKMGVVDLPPVEFRS